VEGLNTLFKEAWWFVSSRFTASVREMWYPEEREGSWEAMACEAQVEGKLISL
jgi:hypothetical protein